MFVLRKQSNTNMRIPVIISYDIHTPSKEDKHYEDEQSIESKKRKWMDDVISMVQGFEISKSTYITMTDLSVDEIYNLCLQKVYTENKRDRDRLFVAQFETESFKSLTMNKDNFRQFELAVIESQRQAYQTLVSS